MSKSINFAIARIAINTVTWTPVNLPWSCQGISYRCDTDVVLMRTDEDDASTQDRTPLGEQEYVLAPTLIWGDQKTWVYVKAQTHDDAVLIVKFTRYQGAAGVQ